MDFLSFTEEKWDANPNSWVNADYAAYVNSHKQSNASLQVQFENANNVMHINTTVCHDNKNSDAFFIIHTADADDLPDIVNNNGENDNQTNALENKDTNNASMDNHLCANEVFENACNNTYTYSYAVGHGAGSSAAYTNRYNAGYTNGFNNNHDANLVSENNLVFDNNNTNRYDIIKEDSDNGDYWTCDNMIVICPCPCPTLCTN